MHAFGESLYLQNYKLEGPQSLPYLGGNAMTFPNEFSGVLEIGEDLKDYSDDESREIVLALLANHLGSETRQIHIAVGASMANFETLLALRGSVQGLIVESPVYEPYRAAAELLGISVTKAGSCLRPFAERWNELDLSRSAVIISSPNFFTGEKISTKDLREICRRAKYLILDEMYYASFNGDGKLCADLQEPNLIRIGSLSKCMGLSMIRFGWVSGPLSIIEKIGKISLVTVTEYPTPSLRIAARALDSATRILRRLQKAGENGRQMVREFQQSYPEIVFTHQFEHGHFGAVKSNRVLSEALSGKWFEAPEMWRFRVDRDHSRLKVFLEGLV